MSSNTISLSRINPDYEYILGQLRRAAQSRATWTSFLTTDVGETLLEYMSVIGEYDQYSISRTFEEMFSETADIDASIYAITKMLGVRLKRKTPSNTYFRLPDSSNAGSYTVDTTTPDGTNTAPNIALNNKIRQQAIGNPYFDSSIPAAAIEPFDVTRITNPVKFWAYGKIKRLVSAEFPANTQMIILPYSRFSSSEGMLFNRQAIKFDAIADVSDPNDKGWFGYSENIDNATIIEVPLLYRGDLLNKFFSATGQDFFSIISSEADFSISDSDVDVFINSQKLNIAKNGLWNYRVGEVGSNIVQDLTTSKGKLHVLFGSSLYGFKPTVNDTVQLRYVVTKGLADNALSFKSNKLSGLDYTLDNSVDTCIYPLINGANQTTPKEYSILGPASFAATDGTKSVTPQDYKTTFKLYDGNLDAIVDGQRDLNRNSPAFMNLVRVVTYPKHTEAFYTTMFNYAKTVTMFTSQFYTEWNGADNPLYPFYRIFNIRANVFCYNSVDLVSGRQAIESALLSLVDKVNSPSIGKLNLDIPKETILKTMREAITGIAYIELIEPSATVMSSMTSPTPTVFSNTGGSAAALTSSIDYAIETFCEDDNTTSSTRRSWGLSGIGTAVGIGQTISVYFQRVPNFTYTVPLPVTNGITNYTYLRNVQYRLWRRRKSLPNPIWEPVSNSLVSDSGLTTNAATGLSSIIDTGTTGITPSPAFPEYNAARPSISLLPSNWLSVNTINMLYV